MTMRRLRSLQREQQEFIHRQWQQERLRQVVSQLPLQASVQISWNWEMMEMPCTECHILNHSK